MKKNWKMKVQENKEMFGKSILQVPDTGTRVLDNTKPFLCSSIVSFWITPAPSKECKYHIFRQYWYTRNVPVFTNTGTFQYLGPELYFFQMFISCPHRSERLATALKWMYCVHHSWLHRHQCNHLCEFQSLSRCSRWMYCTPAFLTPQSNAITCANTRTCSSVAGECN